MSTIIVPIITLILIVGIVMPAFSNIGEGDEICDDPHLGWKQACDAVKKKQQKNIQNVLIFVGIPSLLPIYWVLRKVIDL